MIDRHSDQLIESWDFRGLPADAQIIVIAGNHAEYTRFRGQHLTEIIDARITLRELTSPHELFGYRKNTYHAFVGSWHHRRDILDILRIIPNLLNKPQELRPTRSYVP